MGQCRFLAESVAADDLTGYGTVDFVEVGSARDVDDDDVGGNLPTAHVDQLLFHSSGPQDEVRYLDETFLETPASTFENHRAVAYSEGFASMPVQRSGSHGRVVTTGLGRSYRKTAALELAEPLEPHPVTLDVDGQLATVSTPASDIDVEPGVETVHEMAPRTVSVTVSSLPDEEPPADSREPVRRDTWDERVTIPSRTRVELRYRRRRGGRGPVPETTLGPQ